MTDPQSTRDEDRRSFFILLGMVGALALLIFGGVLLVRAMWVPERVAVWIELTEEPKTVEFDVEEGESIEVWTDLSIEHRKISYQKPSHELPRTMDYVLDFEREGARVLRRRCNPLNSNVARTSYYGAAGGISGREYDGRINDCGVALEPGHYTLTAHRERVGEPRGIRWKRTVLILRVRSQR